MCSSNQINLKTMKSFRLEKQYFDCEILNTFEIKYKAKSSFHKDLITIDKGWSLFEIVTWGK